MYPGGAHSQQQQMLQDALKQQLIPQPSMLQPPLYPSAGLLSAMAQLEPIPSGNIPPGFDATSCRSVYVGNIHPRVTEAVLAELCSTVGPLDGCKMIRKEKSSFGFIDYLEHRYAAAAIVALNGKALYGMPIKVNWAFASGQREDTAGHFNIFVGDLAPEVTDATLYTAFSVYGSCSDARVMWDQRSGRSRGYGFVSFRDQKDADTAIKEMTGKWIASRQIRCNWGARSSGATGQQQQQQEEEEDDMEDDQIDNDDMEVSKRGGVSGNTSNSGAASGSDGHKQMQILNGGRVGGKTGSGSASHSHSQPEGQQFTTVYVGNLAYEVTQTELHRHFYALGIGIIEDVRVNREKGFGFVRYRTHEEAAAAIHFANGRIICGKSVKCSWGSKPTQVGSSSSSSSSSGMSQGLPPPPPLTTPFAASTGAEYGLGAAYAMAEALAYQQQQQQQQQQRLSQTTALNLALLPVPQRQQQLEGVPPARGGSSFDPYSAAAPSPSLRSMPMFSQQQQYMYY